MASTQVVEDDGALEWRKILEQGWTKAEETQDTAATLAAPIETGDVEDDDEDTTAMEVTTSDDASTLLVAVKERLIEARQSAKYHDFLMAISSSTVDTEACLAILAGHDDLIAAFEKCFAPAAPTNEVEPDFMDVDESTERKGPQARASQMVNLVFANKTSHLNERAKMLDYVKARIKQPAFPKRLFVLRGSAGAGGVAWAMESLRKEVDVRGNSIAAQLAHVCATDDFSTSFAGSGSTQMKYIADPKKLGVNSIANEARVRLAMEAGLEPLYVANPCMLLWDMQPYVLLADRFGYEVKVVAPDEICPAWNDLDFLVSRNEEHLSRSALQTMIASFESLPSDADPRPLIRTARKPEEDATKSAGVAKVLKAPALLYKLEKLMLEGSELMRYAPVVGRGWGVDGELDGETHKFRESSNGMCTYEDSIHWQGEDQDAWTFEGITWLDDLRIQAFQLPEAPTKLESAIEASPEDLGDEAPPAPKTPPEAPLKKTTKTVAAEEPPKARSVPTSRKERFKQRALHPQVPQVEAPKPEEEEEEPAAPPAKRPRNVDMPLPKKAKPAASQSFVDADAYQPPKGMPTEEEEMSAATFLAAVKGRLSDWGKVDLYHEFVIALSGSVDAKAAVRILRGHDDLLVVFRRKFAPKADLLQIKAEIDEDDSSVPHAPPMPPPGHHVKQELGRVKQEAGRVKQEPGRVKQELSGVKKELGKGVKTELIGSSIPHPPTYKPGSHRVVSVGDDSDDDGDVMDDVSISLAVKKGKDECIAQLAKCIFRKERASREGVRQRFDMVRYATRRAAKPRFPREVFILRGPPGIGKTDYAVQKLSDHVDIDPGEETGARLTHVCATDDFYELFKGDSPEYKYDSKKLETQQLRNQARVRLAMESGIHPLYIDEPNLRLFEMRPYVALAERLGYVVTIIEPSEISDKWSDVSFLASANDTVERHDVGKVVSQELLQAMLDAYEVLPSGQDPTDVIRVAKQGDAPAVIEVEGGSQPAKRPATGPKTISGKIPAYKGVKTEMGKRTR